MKDHWRGFFQTAANWHSLAFDSHENRTESRTYACSLFDHPQRYLRFLEVLWNEFSVNSEDHLHVHVSELLRDVPRIGAGGELAAVPTPGVLRMLEQRGFCKLCSWTHGVDTQLFAYQPQPRFYPAMRTLVRPVSLFVGRLSYEKNIDAFLDLNIPGTKIVCGVGPLEASLKVRYPTVRWMGVLSRAELAAADVFVFPSKSETFGLVMLEAMACGTPVAAYPVDGPLEVLGKSDGSCHGGVMKADLLQAYYGALSAPAKLARDSQ